MKFDVITLFPEIIDGYCSYSIMSRAAQKGIISIEKINPRDFTEDKHKRVDDTPYGGGAGMVLMCDPIFKAYDSISKPEQTTTIMLTPQGVPFNQELSNKLCQNDKLILLCGHYEGFDERIREGIKPLEVSLGDFVLTGGELGALCIMDSVTRHLEGALGKIESAHYDSFSDGLLEHPHYTRPYDYEGMKVPDVLRSGNHAQIDKWRKKEELKRTFKKRPDLFEKFLKRDLSKNDKILIEEIKNELETKDIDFAKGKD